MDFDKLYNILFLHENGTYRALCANARIDKETMAELEKIKCVTYADGIKILKKALQELKDDKENKVIPEIYRKAMFFLTCKLCDEAGIKGAQKKVLDDLNLSHNTFSKYKMTPVQYFVGVNFEVDKELKLSLSRYGKKNKDLCRTFIDLSSQVTYTDFVDVFGGLGTITVRKPEVSKEYINDFDNSVYKFLTVIKQYPVLLIRWEEKVITDIYSNEGEEKQIEYAKSLFKRFQSILDDCNSSLTIMNKLRVVYNKVSNIRKGNISYNEEGYYSDATKLRYVSEIYQAFLAEKDKKSFLKYVSKDIAENDNDAIDKFEKYFDEFVYSVNKLFADPREKNIQYAYGFYDELFGKNVSIEYKVGEVGHYKGVEYQEEEAKINFESLIDIAGAFYFVNSFNINGKASASGINIKSLKKFRDKLKNIKNYSERLKKVTILHQDFRDVIMSFNNKSTLLYLDSPYIDTVGYNVLFEDQEFFDLANLLNEFKGKWIFSCRCSLEKYYYKAELVEDEKKAELTLNKLRRLADFLNLFRFRGYYVVEIPLKKGADGYSDVELMITNFEFIHENVKKFDELYIEYASEYDLQ